MWAGSAHKEAVPAGYAGGNYAERIVAAVDGRRTDLLLRVGAAKW